MSQKKSEAFERIKKQNGERFARMINDYDNGIFDIPDIVDIVKYAGRDAGAIAEYLESLKLPPPEPQLVCKDPITLLDEAGYDAFYADTLEKQNAPKKYFAPGEELCTFKDSTRYKLYHIIWAIKKDVDKIKREDFIGKEKREDAYGTSVICIQILKTGGFISIKNRYNHIAQNPDNTFYSRPDNIIPGLSASLQHHFQVDFSPKDVKLLGNFMMVDHKLVHYKRQIDNVFLGENFYVKDGVVYPLDRDKEILMDNFVFNIKDRTVKNLIDSDDCFPKVLMQELRGKKLQLYKDKQGYHLTANKQELITIQDGQITSLNLPTTRKIGKEFLEHNVALESFNAPLARTIGKCCLIRNQRLSKLNLPSAQWLDDYFLDSNRYLTVLSLPSLQGVGHAFLRHSTLRVLDVPMLKKVGAEFLRDNGRLEVLNAPRLEKIGYSRLERLWKSMTMSAPPNFNTLCLPSNEVYKTNAPVLIGGLPSERILPTNVVWDTLDQSSPLYESLCKIAQEQMPLPKTSERTVLKGHTKREQRTSRPKHTEAQLHTHRERM